MQELDRIHGLLADVRKTGKQIGLTATLHFIMGKRNETILQWNREDTTCDVCGEPITQGMPVVAVIYGSDSLYTVTHRRCSDKIPPLKSPGDTLIDTQHHSHSCHIPLI